MFTSLRRYQPFNGISPASRPTIHRLNDNLDADSLAIVGLDFAGVTDLVNAPAFSIVVVTSSGITQPSPVNLDRSTAVIRLRGGDRLRRARIIIRDSNDHTLWQLRAA